MQGAQEDCLDSLKCKRLNAPRCFWPFAAQKLALARMALTIYLLQTFIATVLFYAWGLGLFDQLGREPK